MSTGNSQFDEGPTLLAYTDPLSVAPGDTINLMVSATAPHTVGLLRLVHGARDPRGPGVREEIVHAALATRDAFVQPLPSGSHLRIPGHPCFDGPALTMTAWIFPTLTAGGTPRALLSRRDAIRGGGWALGLTGDDHLALWAGAGDEPILITDRAVPTGRWTFVGVSIDPDGAVIVQVPVPEWPVESWRASARFSGRIDLGGAGIEPLIGAWWTADGDRVVASAHFNGVIDRPAIFAGAAAEEALALAEPGSLGLSVLGRWHPGREPHRLTVHDGGPNGLHAAVVNTPARGIPGCNWTGHEIDFRLARDEFDAIHFHDDDLTDAAWEPTVTLRIPDDMRSGIYAFRLETDDGEQLRIPFFVRPPRRGATAKVAVMIPSFTYLAYTNRHRTMREHDYDHTPQLDWAARHRVGGFYDLHGDGSGCYYASRRRPLVTMEPYLGGCGWELWNLSADLCLIDWLETEGIAYDVICDEDVHGEGVDLLARYSVVVSGTHPEYVTHEILDALEGYLNAGGRLMYLGGNGYYWVTGVSAAEPHVIEIRRGHAGTRCWEVPPGQTHLSTTGEVGGLWRHRGRTPQRLVGVGFTADILNEPRFDAERGPQKPESTVTGVGKGRPYDPAQIGIDQRGGFALEGVVGSIDALGLVAGAPGGVEIDRFDASLGSPPHAVVLATACGFTDAYQHVVEEVRSSNSRQGGPVEPRVRADLVFFETPRGGAVFSTGSMAWITCLGVDSHDNPVARVTGNVLRRFLDPAPLVSTAPDTAAKQS